jgi:hypothetical protein
MEHTLARPKPLGTTLLLTALAATAAFIALRATLTPPPVTIPPYTAHEVDRHADVISAAVSCFSGYGTISPRMMYNPATRRQAWMCQMGLDMFIWIINEDGTTETMFKNKSKTFEQAIHYLTNRGYLP